MVSREDFDFNSPKLDTLEVGEEFDALEARTNEKGQVCRRRPPARCGTAIDLVRNVRGADADSV